MIDKMNFVIYTKENCTHCIHIKQIFKLKNLNYVEYKLDQHFDAKSFILEFGKGTTFPQVVLDETIIGGASDTVKYLKENNII